MTNTTDTIKPEIKTEVKAEVKKVEAVVPAEAKVEDKGRLPEKAQKKYFFPRLGKIIKAISLKEAISKLKEVKK